MQTAQEIEVAVVCDEFSDQIRIIKKSNSELPQKFYIAYIDKLKAERGDIEIPNDPSCAYLFQNEDEYKRQQKSLRLINLVDSMLANAIGKANPPMLIQFIARNKAA